MSHVLTELVVVLTPSPEPLIGLSLCYEMERTFRMCKNIQKIHLDDICELICGMHLGSRSDQNKFRNTLATKQDKYTMDPGSQIDRSNQKIIFSKK